MIYSDPYRLFGPGGCLTNRAIRSYVEGTLRPGGRALVDEHIKKCRICAEAMEGLKKYGRSRNLKEDLDFLSRKVRYTYAGRRLRPGSRVPLLILISVAAILLLLLGIFYIFRQDMSSQRMKTTRMVPDTSVSVVKSLPDSSNPGAVKPKKDGIRKKP